MNGWGEPSRKVWNGRMMEVRTVELLPGPRQFKVFLDVRKTPSEKQLTEMILTINKMAVKEQQKHPDRGGATLQLVTPDRKQHIVFSADYMLLTDDQTLADRCFRAGRRD